MKTFKIGDKVIALTDSPDESCQQRVKGKLYVVCSILYCCKCGVQSINIGQKVGSMDGVSRCPCGHKQAHEGLYWTVSKHFAKVDDYQESLNEALFNEDYELAALLRNLRSKQLTNQ